MVAVSAQRRRGLHSGRNARGHRHHRRTRQLIASGHQPTSLFRARVVTCTNNLSQLYKLGTVYSTTPQGQLASRQRGGSLAVAPSPGFRL